MLRKWSFIAVSLCLFSALLVAGGVASQSAPPEPAAQQKGAQQPASGQSGYVLKVTTRLVTLDLIATDSHGNPVRDLKPEDLQIFEEHKAKQKIEHFEYFEKMAGAGAPGGSNSAIRKPANVLSNQFPLDQLKIPPTVVLMDSLNTQTANQQQGRAHMIQLLRTLPPETPVAVFLLGSSLRILQGFTSDGRLLRAALDRAVAGATVEEDPLLDTQNTSSYIQNATAGVVGNLGLQSQLGEVQNFEKEEYGMTVDLRAKETLGAMAQIGQYLSGIPGRKNLIWVSESFPFSIAPDPDTGNNPFAGLRSYADQVKLVANVLTDVQVAVYPLDVRGLQANQSLSASQDINLTQNRMTGPAMAGRLNQEDTDLLQAQGTMEELAQDTGGKACKNNNDLSGCLMTALKDSSSYYEMSFYPQKVNWDGRFHKIVVKTSRPGVKLTYRRGYYALDAPSLAKKQQPEDHLRQACADQLPSTTIPLTVQAVAPGQNGSPQGGLQYMLLISAAGLGSVQGDKSYSLNIRMADCEFAQKNTIFRFNEKELTKTVSAEVFRSWQSTGIPEHVALLPAADTQRIRLVVLDASSGLTGAIDIPVLPSEIAKATAPVSPPVPVAPPAPVVTTPYLELPDKVKAPSPPKVVASLTFHLNSGASGTLDWSGDTLLYHAEGDMPLDQAAKGFSSYAFGGRFHCQDGHFVPLNPTDGDPTLQFSFHNNSGKLVAVDLKGEQPVYLGDLPVDPSAQSLFDQVWKSSHCQEQ
ncbi:MAG: VWA domain-containing protein [Candidatus Acidiferrales bacterium]